jgi:hypothetical protein
MAMIKFKYRDLEIQAPNVRDFIVVLDKFCQYEKIREIKDGNFLMACIDCGSYDIEAIAPNIVQCRMCGVEMEHIIEYELDPDDEK